MTEHIVVIDQDATRTITMRRPDKKNALTQDMYRAMSEAINSAQGDPAIRCLVIAGVPGAFTAGNDLEDFLQAGTATPDKPRPMAAMEFLHTLVNNGKPIVAAVDGIAVGIGTTMVFHCDYVLASDLTGFFWTKLCEKVSLERSFGDAEEEVQRGADRGGAPSDRSADVAG